MISLKDYKEMLVNTHVYEYDNNEEMRRQRRILLDKQMNDEFLKQVIRDTYSFIKDVFDSDTISKDYCSFEIDENETKYISLNLIGGYESDTLYKDLKGRVISKRILNKLLGNYANIFIRDDEIPFETNDPDIVSYDYRVTINISGFTKNVHEIRYEILGDIDYPFDLYKELLIKASDLVEHSKKEEVLEGLSELLESIKDIAKYYDLELTDVLNKGRQKKLNKE